MKKSIKIFIIVLVCVIALAGVGVGAYFLFRDDGVQTPPPKYSQTEQDFIDSIIESNGKVESSEETISLPANVRVSDVVDILDDYIIANIDGSEQIIRRSDASVIEFSNLLNFNDVICIYKDYALVQNTDSLGSLPFVVNLSTQTLVCDGLEFNNYYDRYFNEIDGYAFVGNYLVISTSDNNYPLSTEFFVKVYNLQNGELSLNLSPDNELQADDRVISYATADSYLLVKTLKNTLVYDLASSNSINVVLNFNNSIYEMVGSSTSYDYNFNGSKYFIEVEHNVAYLGNGKFFVTRMEQCDLISDAQFVMPREIYNDEGTFLETINKFFNQFYYFYDTLSGTNKALNFDGFYVTAQHCSFNNFALLFKFEIESQSKEVIQTSPIATYYELTNFDEIFSYNYYDYGDVIGFYDDKIILASNLGRNYGAILDIDGQVVVELPINVRIRNSVSYDGYFIVSGGGYSGIYNINGEQLLELSYSSVSPVISGHSIVERNGRVYNFNVLTKELTLIENYYSEFLPYSIKGVDFYVTYENGEYNIYSLQGTLLAEGLTEIKLIDVEGGVKVVYESENVIKALTSGNSKVKDDTTIATVSNKYTSKYNFASGTAFAENVVTVNEPQNVAQTIEGDISNFFNPNYISSETIIDGSVTVYTFSQGGLELDLTGMLAEAFEGDRFGLNESGQTEYKDVYTASHEFSIDGNDEIVLRLTLTLRARFNNLHGYTADGTNRVDHIGQDVIDSFNDYFYDITGELVVECSEGYNFGLYDSSNFIYVFTPDVLTGQSAVTAYYNDSFPTSTLSIDIEEKEVFGYSNSDGHQSMLYLRNAQFTISPILYSNTNLYVASNATGNYIDPYVGIYENMTVGADNERAVEAGGNAVSPSLFSSQRVNGYNYQINAGLGVYFAVEETETYSSSAEIDFSGFLWGTQPRQVVFVESYSSVSFTDVDANGSVYDVINNAIESGNSGSDGKVQIYKNDIYNTLMGNTDDAEGENLLFTTEELEEIFKSDGSYYIFSGGRGVGILTDSSEWLFYGTADVGFYGIVNNVKVRNGFPFEFRKAGYDVSTLNIDNSVYGPPVGPVSDGEVTLNPVYYVNNSGNLIVTNYGDYAIYGYNGSENIEMSADNTTNTYNVRPIYQLFFNDVSEFDRTVFDSNLTEYTFQDNTSTSARLRISWEAKDYELYFYAEQEEFDGFELVGSATASDRDWFFPSTNENGEYETENGQQLYTFSSNIFSELNSNTEVITNGFLNGVGLVVGMQSANTVGFGSELVGLPIPVKYGYEFVGWKAMRVVEGENGESVLEPVQIEVDGNLVDAIVREGDTLNFNNCDVLNEWNELHFVAVFEAKEIELRINFGSDNFFTQNGISLNDVIWKDTLGWDISTSGRNVVFSRTVTIEDLRDPESGTFLAITIPSPAGSRWQVVNFSLELFNNKAGAETYVTANYIPYENGAQTNNDPNLAKNFNLVRMLEGVSTAVYDAGFKEDSINIASSGTYTGEFYINNGYNINSLNLNAIPIWVDYFVDLNVSGYSNAGLTGNYYINGLYDEQTEISVPAPVGNANGDKAFVHAYGSVNFVEIDCNSVEYRFNTLKIKIYTGNGADSVSLSYTLVWKNNVYYGVTYGGYSSSGGVVLTGEQVASLIGLTSEDDFANLVSFDDNKINIAIPQITTGTAGRTEEDIISQSDGNGNLTQVYIKAIELEFGVSETAYDMVIGAATDSGTGIDSTFVTNLANQNVQNANIGGEVSVDGKSTNNSETPGYTITQITKNGTKTLSILCGGSFDASQAPRYSHFVSNIIVANLVNSTYSENKFTYSVSEDDYFVIGIDISVRYENGIVYIDFIVNNGNNEVATFSLNSGGGTLENSVEVGNGDLITFSATFGNNGTFNGTFTLNISYSVNPSQQVSNEVNNDRLVGVLFKEYANGSYVYETYLDGELDENSSSQSEENFNATEINTISIEPISGYYLKTLTITNLFGEELVVLSGYPNFDFVNTRLQYIVYPSNLDINSSPYYIDGTLISISGINFSAGGYFTGDSVPALVVTLDGLYTGVTIKAEFESITALYVENNIVDFDGTNVSDLDFNVTLGETGKTLKSLQDFAQFQAPAGTDGSYTLATANYYILPENNDSNALVFILLGQGECLNIDVNVEDIYTPYLQIGLINGQDFEDDTVRVTGVNLTNNLAAIVFEKKLTEYTFTLNLGYYNNSLSWGNYSVLGYYSDDEFKNYLSLLNNRLEDFTISYYGSNSNPLDPNSVQTLTDLSREIEISAFDNTAIVLSFKLSDYYKSVEIFDVSNAVNLTSNYTVENTDGNYTITINNSDYTHLNFRFGAKSYQMTYMPNRPSSAGDSSVNYTLGSNRGTLDETGYELTVWFDNIVNSVNYLGVTLVGHDFVEWNSLASGEGTSLTIDNTPINESFVTDATESSAFNVYAIWTVKKITVTFDVNDPTTTGYGSTTAEREGAATSHEYNYNDEYGEYLPNNTNLRRDGYTLDGWQRSGGVAVTGEENIIREGSRVTFANANEESNNRIVLYARWIPNVYNVYYHKANRDVEGNAFVGEGVQQFAPLNEQPFFGSYNCRMEGDDLVVEVEFDSSLPYPTITFTGYDLLGWFINNIGESISQIGGTQLLWEHINGDRVEVYPHWQLQGVKVLLITGNGQLSQDDETLLETLAISSLELLLYSVDGGLNGLTDNFYTYTIEGVAYNINIPYYSSAGYEISNGREGETLRAPVADGFIFSGYWYYNGQNFVQYITTNSNNECVLSRTWNIYQEYQQVGESTRQIIPVKLYAQWEIKKFEVSISVGDEFDGLFEGLGLGYEGYTGENASGYRLTSPLVITLIKRPYNSSVITGSETLSSSGEISITYEFYESVGLEITMAEGHYLSRAIVNGQSFNATWNSSSFSTTGLSEIYSGSERIGRLDNMTFNYGAYYAHDDSAVDDDSLRCKRDIRGTINNIVTNYDINLEFARQYYHITIIKMRYNAQNDTVSEFDEHIIFTVPHRGEFAVGKISGGAFLQSDGIYTDPGCKEALEGQVLYVYEDTTLYMKYIPDLSDVHAGHFYGWGGSGYVEINTGSNYIYSVVSDDVRYINGENAHWTDCLVGMMIQKFPILTAFYWPDEVDGDQDTPGVRTGLHFAYWVEFGSSNISPSKILTPYVLQTDYINTPYTIVRAGHALDAGDRYYAVFESYDKKVEIDSITGSGDGSHDDFFMQISGNGQYKTLTFRLGTSKIDVKEAYFQVLYNGMLYEFAAETNGIYTQNVYYEFNLLDDIPGFSGGTVEVRFKIVSSAKNIYYSTYNDSDYYTVEIVNNSSDYSRWTATGTRVTNPTGGYAYYSYGGGYYLDLDITIIFNYQENPNYEVGPYYPPTLSSGGSAPQPNTFVISVGGSSYRVTISAGEGTEMTDTSTGSVYWVHSLSVDVRKIS